MKILRCHQEKRSLYPSIISTRPKWKPKWGVTLYPLALQGNALYLKKISLGCVIPAPNQGEITQPVEHNISYL